MNKKYLLTTIKIMAFGIVPFLAENGKKALDKALENIDKTVKEE